MRAELVVGVTCRLELEGAVLDVEVIGEADGEVIQDACVDHHAHGQHREPGGEGPGVQIVGIHDTGVSRIR